MSGIAKVLVGEIVETGEILGIRSIETANSWIAVHSGDGMAHLKSITPGSFWFSLVIYL